MTHKARLLMRLSDGCWHSYRSLYDMGIMVHSRVADLRRDGYQVECAKDEQNYRYRLTGRASEVPPTTEPDDGTSDASPFGVDEPSAAATARQPVVAAASSTPEPLFEMRKEPAWS